MKLKHWRIKSKNMELKLITNLDKEFVKNIDKNINDIDFNNLVFTKSGYVIYHEKKANRNNLVLSSLE